jgi:hypothetical protein
LNGGEDSAAICKVFSSIERKNYFLFCYRIEQTLFSSLIKWQDDYFFHWKTNFRKKPAKGILPSTMRLHQEKLIPKLRYSPVSEIEWEIMSIEIFDHALGIRVEINW